MASQAADIAKAAAAAGPLMLALLGLGHYAQSVPEAFPVTGEGLLAIIGALFAALLIGFLPALATIGAGVALMELLGSLHPVNRHPLAWALAGGTIAAGLPLAFDGEPLMIFAFAGSGAICALLCRPRLRTGDRGG